MLAALASAAVIGVSPQIPHRDGLVQVHVAGIDAPKVCARFAGGLASGGHWFGFIQLQPSGAGSWHALLRAPGFLGVYPLQLKVGKTIEDTGRLVKILPGGFERQPAFFTPREVAEWWATRLPAGSHVVTTSVWHSGFFTHRDPRFNLLLKTTVQYATGGGQTFYVSMARLRADGPWRLLEATTAP